MRCDKCRKLAITYIRYSGSHLCAEHFNSFVEQRVKRVIRSQCYLGKDESIAVALSGGKDSTLTLYLLNKIFQERMGISIVAITVDEGIKGYRDKSISVAKKITDELNVQHFVVKFEDIVGYTVDEIRKSSNMIIPCAYCGVFRRHCLNITAKKIKATKLAVGLNLDDTVQSILMNFCRGDIPKLARMGPHKVVQKGLVPRILPLRKIPEKESYLYCITNNIKFYHAPCPYAEYAVRNKFRSIVYDLERDMPGTRYAILKSYEILLPLIIERYPYIELKNCKICGEPTDKQVCNSCINLRRILDNIQ